MELRFLIRKDYPVFNLTTTLTEILAKMRVSDKDVYAVTNEANILMGVIYLNDIKSIILGPREDAKNITAGDIMMKQVMLTIEDDMESAIQKYEKLNSAKNVLPIVDKEGKWLGFISKASILDKYRAEIVKTS